MMTTPFDLLRDIAMPGLVLAICHNPSDTAFLSFAAKHDAKLWMRVAGGLEAPQPWPDAGRYDAIILPLPANRETLSLCLAAACTTLTSAGTLYLFGTNATGIKSAGNALAVYFNEVELLGIGGHGRLYAARYPIRQDYTLDGFRQEMQLMLPGGTVAMASYPGLFAKGKLDMATAFLLEHLPAVEPQTQVLDFACGIGVIGKAVHTQQPKANLTLVDHDVLAITVARLNLPTASMQYVASPAKITGLYDLIFSNPPIHDGQTLSYAIVESFIAELPRLLAPKAEAYIVAQITVPVSKMAIQKKLTATAVAANKSFRITKLTHL